MENINISYEDSGQEQEQNFLGDNMIRKNLTNIFTATPENKNNDFVFENDVG